MSVAHVIDGKTLAASILQALKEKVKQASRQLTLAVVQVGDDPASAVYIRNKQKACETVGIRSLHIHLETDVSRGSLMDVIHTLNSRADVDGILLQLPLPPGINADDIIRAIAPEKDVDGFHPLNVGNMMLGEACLLPCTPAGIVALLKSNDVEIAGKDCVVIGRSNIVGKPVAQLLLQEHATVTQCHSRTRDLQNVCRRADILVVAAGIPRFIRADFVKPGAVVIDVGIHRTAEHKLCGDVDFDSVKTVASAITPVPGGVGPMTIAMLMQNCVNAGLYRI